MRIFRHRAPQTLTCLLALLPACAAGCRDKTGASGDRPGHDATTREARPAPPAGILVDPAARRVSVPAAVAEQGRYEDLEGAVEYVLVSSGGKAYESLFVTAHAPAEIDAALRAIGLRGGRAADDDRGPRGQRVRIFVEPSSPGGEPARRPIDAYILSAATARPLEPADWVYTGSPEVADPVAGATTLQASLTRSVVGLQAADASALVHNARPGRRGDNPYKANLKALPREGTAVRVVFEWPQTAAPAGVVRMRVLIAGRVQGVGFRSYAERQALLLGLGGFVRNLGDGRVEAEIEGAEAKVAELVEMLRHGPRGARVEELNVTPVPAQGDAGPFEVWW